jgi:hypothetical protein
MHGYLEIKQSHSHMLTSLNDNEIELYLFMQLIHFIGLYKNADAFLSLPGYIIDDFTINI